MLVILILENRCNDIGILDHGVDNLSPVQSVHWSISFVLFILDALTAKAKIQRPFTPKATHPLVSTFFFSLPLSHSLSFAHVLKSVRPFFVTFFLQLFPASLGPGDVFCGQERRKSSSSLVWSYPDKNGLLCPVLARQFCSSSLFLVSFMHGWVDLLTVVFCLGVFGCLLHDLVARTQSIPTMTVFFDECVGKDHGRDLQQITRETANRNCRVPSCS